MKSLSKISSHIRYGVARAKKSQPCVFISSINIQRFCRTVGRKIQALRPLLLSVLSLVLVWYLYGILFGTSQTRTTQRLPNDYLLSRDREYSKSGNKPAQSTFAPLQRTKSPIIQSSHKTDKVSALHSNTDTMTSVPLCRIPHDLGPISAKMTNMTLDEVETKYSEVHHGGWYTPQNCATPHKVAIIVPYRDRKINLAIFLNHMHPFLMKQRLEYRIFIVEQQGTHEFNRGKLLNVGFVESQKHGSWRCFIFHDVDLLPLDQRNLYSCPHPQRPRFLDSTMAIANQLNDSTVAPKAIYGGVSALTRGQFANANGYSNGYWGFAGEDDDLYYRLAHLEYSMVQYDRSIARYAALNHKQKSLNPVRHRLLLQTLKTYRRDGLNQLEYQLVSVNLHHLYTHIVVNVDQSYHDLQELFQEQKNLEFYRGAI